MSKTNGKQNNISEIKEEELTNSGVAKLLIQENENLRGEIDILKKSLKKTQDAFEKLRGRLHEVEKENVVLSQKDKDSVAVEIIKFCASSAFGVGTAILTISHYKQIALGLIVLGIIVYIIAMVIRRR